MLATGMLRNVSLTFIEGQLRIILCGSPAAPELPYWRGVCVRR